MILFYCATPFWTRLRNYHQKLTHRLPRLLFIYQIASTHRNTHCKWYKINLLQKMNENYSEPLSEPQQLNGGRMPKLDGIAGFWQTSLQVLPHMSGPAMCFQLLNIKATKKRILLVCIKTNIAKFLYKSIFILTNSRSLLSLDWKGLHLLSDYFNINALSCFSRWPSSSLPLHRSERLMRLELCSRSSCHLGAHK